jgi:hypothetical protein
MRIIFTRIGCTLLTCDIYMSDLRHIHDPVISSLKMKGIYLLFFYVSLNISPFIFLSESPVREPLPRSLTGFPWAGIPLHQNHCYWRPAKMINYRVIKKYLCTWQFYCNHQVYRDVWITLYIF